MPASTSRGAFPYPLAADAPPNVHLDIKALADRNAATSGLFQQGVLASRPAAATANQGMLYKATDGTKHLYYSDGSIWTRIDPLVDRRVPTDGFPSSPVEGDYAKFVVVQFGQFAATCDWEFAYYAGLGDAYKWQFVGGGAASFLNATGFTFTADGSGPDVATSPVFTAPFAGYYQVEWGATINLPAASSLGALTTSGAIQLLQGAGNTLAASSPTMLQPINASGQSFAFCSTEGVLMTASQILRVGSVASSASGSSNYTLSHVFMSVTPIRVSP